MEQRRTDIVVDFFVPGVPRERASAIGEFYVGLYTHLYDEDVWMMTVRQEHLDRIDTRAARIAPQSRVLGTAEQIRNNLPMRFELDGRDFRLVEERGQLVAHSTVCPHMLGPLDEAAIDGGIIECPWHGYRFDIRTRRCVSGARCSLGPAPLIRLDAATSQIVADWPGGGSS